MEIKKAYIVLCKLRLGETTNTSDSESYVID